MKLHRTCDGMKRRDMLKAGTLTIGGLTLSSYMRMAHAGQILKQIRVLGLRYAEVPVNIRYTSYSLAKGQKLSNLFNIVWESMMELLRK